MTQPGWYPDQSGGPGKKYWDGRAWHDAIPAAPPSPGPVPRPNVLPPKQAAGESRTNRIVSAVVGAFVTIGGFFAIANWLTHPAKTPRISSANVPSIAVPSFEVPASPRSQDAALGTPLTVNLSQIQMNGTFTKATAVINVGNLTQMSSGVLPPSGTYYAVGVAVSAVSGTVSVNPFFFAARTANGTNLTPVGIVDNILPSTELPQGQKVAGFLDFDVPTGQRITEILFEEPGGPQLGRWLVK